MMECEGESEEAESESEEADDTELRRRVEEIFEREVVLRDAAEAARQVAAGACVRVVLPPDLFSRGLRTSSIS